MAQERAELDRLEQERLFEERAEGERIARERSEAETLERGRAAQEQARLAQRDQERLAQERAESQRFVEERAAIEEAERERLSRERADRDRLERERSAQERSERERIAGEIAEAENVEQERLAAARAELDRVEQARLAHERSERDRIALEKAVAKIVEREARAQERAERDQLERERLERERMAGEKRERQDIARDAAKVANAEKAEGQGLTQEQEARESGDRGQALKGWSARLKVWLDRRRAAPPGEDLRAAVWQMPVGRAGEPTVQEPQTPEPPAPERGPHSRATPKPPQETSTATIAVAEINPSVTMTARAQPVVEPESEPDPGIGRPLAKERLPVSEVVPIKTPEAVFEDAAEELAFAESGAPALGESRTATRGGGRAARLLAEDAADLRAKDQRFKYLGHSEVPAAETEPSAEPDATTAAEVLGRRGGGGPGRAVALFVFLAIMAAAVVGSASLWVPRVKQFVQGAPAVVESVSVPADPAAAVQTEIAALKARVAALERGPGNPVSPDGLNAATQALAQRLAAIESRAGGAGGGEAVTSLGDSLSSQAEQLTAVTARLATLEAAIGNSARLEDLSKRLNMLEGRSAEANSVLALSDRVTVLETTGRRTLVEQSGNIAMLMAVAQWREAVLAGRPFAVELEIAKMLAVRAGGQSIDDGGFAEFAARGIPTLQELERRFGPAAAAVMRAGAIPDGAGAWYRRILDRIFSIVTVRRLDGEAAGTSISAVLARAKLRLTGGDLAAAVVEMNSLSATVAKTAAPWLADAKARVAAEKAAADATTMAVAAVAATGAGATPPTPVTNGR